MLKELVKIRIKYMFSGFFKGSRKKQKASGKTALKGVAIGLLAIYVIGCFCFMFGALFGSVAEPLASADLLWFYFSLAGIMVFLLCFVGSVFMTQNQLYDANDNDLLLSMPIPTGYILASRLLALISLNYIYEIIIVLPAAFIYVVNFGASVVGVISFAICFLLLPLMVMALSALFGWIIGLINTKMRNKNLITLILTCVFFFAYMYACLQFQNYINLLVARGEEIAAAVKSALPPFYYLGDAIYSGSIVSFILYALCCIVPFVIMYWILSKTFIKIATTKRGMKKVKYKEEALKTASPNAALVTNEIRHFVGMPMYMFNAGIGLPFMVIAAIFLLVKKNTLIQGLTMFGLGSDVLGPVICVGFAMMCAMVIISAPSISIEGKTFWITQSAPVDEKDILIAKAKCHIYVSLPFIIVSDIICLIGFRMSILSSIMIFLVPIGVTVMNALLGVVINLKLPKFDWVNEIVAIKQGMSSIVAMFVSFAAAVLPTVVYAIWIFKIGMVSGDLFLVLSFVYYAVVSAALYMYMTTKGVQIMKALHN